MKTLFYIPLNKAVTNEAPGSRKQLPTKKVTVHGPQGVYMADRHVRPGDAKSTQKRGAAQPQESPVSFGETAGSVPPQIKKWQDDQITHLTGWAAKNNLLQSEAYRFTVDAIRKKATPEDVQAFISTHKNNRNGIPLAAFSGKSAEGSNKSSGSADLKYIGRVKDGSAHKFMYQDASGKKRERSKPPEDHPDYDVYQQQVAEKFRKEHPYKFKYRNLPELTQYPTKKAKNVKELYANMKQIHSGAVLSWTDEGGKTQTAYTKLFREARDTRKFLKLKNFALSYPRIMRNVNAELKNGEPGSTPFACATVLKLMDEFKVRVGDDDKLEGVGATTLQKQHVKLLPSEVTLDFKGKSGVDWNLSVSKAKHPDLYKALQYFFKHTTGKDSPLFTVHVVSRGEKDRLTSDRVSGYMRRVAQAAHRKGTDDWLDAGAITPKELRTYHATRMMKEALAKMLANPPKGSVEARKTELKAQFKKALQSTADAMGHTPDVCLKHYIDPDVVRHAERRLIGDGFRFMKSLRAVVDEDHESFLDYLGDVEHFKYGGNARGHLEQLEQRINKGFDPEHDADLMPQV